MKAMQSPAPCSRDPTPTPIGSQDTDITLSKYPKLRPLFLMVFLESFGLSLAAPVISFFVIDEMHQGTFELGMVGSAFATSQVLGAAFAGRLSDAYGRRPVVIVSFFWAALGFFGTAIVTTFNQLLVARAFAGITGGTWPICQAYAIDVVPEEDRGQYLGLLSATFAMGFIFGPGLATFLLGTHLTTRRMVFAISGIICLIGAISGACFLKESMSEDKKRPIVWTEDDEEAAKVEKKKKQKSDWEAVNLGMVCVWGVRFCAATAQYIVYAMYAPLLEDLFNMHDEELGLILVVGGITAVFVQALLFPSICKLFGGFSVLGLGMFLLGASLCFLPVITNFAVHCIFMILYCLGEGFVEPGTPLVLAFYATESFQGFANGWGSAFRGIAAVAAPLIGGELYSRYSVGTFYFAGVWALIGCICVFVAAKFATKVDPDDEDDEIDETSKLIGDTAKPPFAVLNAETQGEAQKAKSYGNF
eukprot:TRINITY_DN40434_c0_g1_i1.p1 TRINITY_DN40434_c0_g1~~TRINITY_DN40434_c0_g1_i1.p1  ORF type:complete len:475 (+),score=105.01 TRINITY_DN40434_c0_g1_i1:171-1595(+)